MMVVVLVVVLVMMRTMGEKEKEVNCARRF